MIPKSLSAIGHRHVTRIVLVVVAACMALVAAPAWALVRFYATTTTNHLLSFYDVSNTPFFDKTITGLAVGEVVGGIDFRPATGELYGIARGINGIRIVRIDVVTAAATAVNAQPLVVAGSAFGISFENGIDRIRLVSDSDVNVRINPLNGQITPDTALAYVSGDPQVGTTPNVVHLAQRDQNTAFNRPMYGMDMGSFTLVQLGDISGTPATINAGQLKTIGSLGQAPTNPKIGGFDIHQTTGVAYAIMQIGANPALFEVNLTTGALFAGSSLDTGGAVINGLAVAQIDNCADIDGNGKVDALTDGLMYIRALFGLTGTSVTTGAVGEGALRTTWSAVRGFMNSWCGTTWVP